MTEKCLVFSVLLKPRLPQVGGGPNKHCMKVGEISVPFVTSQKITALSRFKYTLSVEWVTEFIARPAGYILYVLSLLHHNICGIIRNVQEEKWQSSVTAL